MKPNYKMIPEHMREGMELYIEKGVPPGDFLSSFLCNDLFGTLSHADDINRNHLYGYFIFLCNEVPRHCWGSKEQFSQWCDIGGLEGIERRLHNDVKRS